MIELHPQQNLSQFMTPGGELIQNFFIGYQFIFLFVIQGPRRQHQPRNFIPVYFFDSLLTFF